MSRAGRLAGAGLFVTCLAVCLVPAGCGATDEYASVPEHPTDGALPASTVRALQACVEERAGRLQRHAYEIEFQVALKGDRVLEVKPKGPRLDDAGLEGCMIDALRRMADAGYAPDPDALISRGSLLPARGVLANVSVISQLIRLVPVVVSASGVTIVVGVAVLVVAAAVSLTERKPTEEECKAQKKRATADCNDWLEMPNPPRERIGPLGTLADCIASNISEACGGKKFDRERSPQYDQSRPGMRF